MIRNFINIMGITPEEEINCKDGLIVYSETETIFIPEDKSAIKSIGQIIIDIDITSTRTIDTKCNKIVIIDGRKRIKIFYSGSEGSEVNIISLEYPYNTFFELPIDKIIDYDVNVMVIDAFFEPTDSRRIYSNFTYLVNIDLKYGEQQNIKDEN